MTRPWRLLLGLHLAFAAGAGLAYLLEPPSRVQALVLVAAGYVLGLLLVARAAGRPDWRAWWALLAPLSVLQVLPDWVLVEIAGTLAFPDLGAPRFGDAVPLYMAGLWVPPLLLVLLLSRGSAWAGAAWAVVVFGVAELLAPALGLWEPQGDVRQLGSTALYVLPAEAVLGAAVVAAARRTRTTRDRLLAAPAIALLYTGALLVSLLLLDRGRLVLTG